MPSIFSSSTFSPISGLNVTYDQLAEEMGGPPTPGIGYYVYGIGTTPTGTYNTLANVKWWQVVNAANVSINMNLDPTQTYYVSVYAVNGAGVGHLTMQILGGSGYVHHDFEVLLVELAEHHRGIGKDLGVEGEGAMACVPS